MGNDNGKICALTKSTYKRHGTLNLFAALRVATEKLKRHSTQRKRREEFLQFMDQIVEETLPEQEFARDLGPITAPQEVRRLAGPAFQRPFSLHPHLGQLAESSGKFGSAFCPARPCAA